VAALAVGKASPDITRNWLAASIRDHRYLGVLRETNDVLREIPGAEPGSSAGVLSHKDLGNVVLPSVVHNRFGNVDASNYARFDLQAAGKAQVFFHGLAFIRYARLADNPLTIAGTGDFYPSSLLPSAFN
jgi:hypothetical protein